MVVKITLDNCFPVTPYRLAVYARMIRSDATGESVRQPVRIQSHEDGRMRWTAVRVFDYVAEFCHAAVDTGTTNGYHWPTVVRKVPSCTFNRSAGFMYDVGVPQTGAAVNAWLTLTRLLEGIICAGYGSTTCRRCSSFTMRWFCTAMRCFGHVGKGVSF